MLFRSVGVFGRAEAEAAAGLIIATLALDGDEWGPCEFSKFPAYHVELSKLLWVRNPILRPDIDELVSRGFATISSDRTTAELTPKALDVLEECRWRKSSDD